MLQCLTWTKNKRAQNFTRTCWNLKLTYRYRCHRKSKSILIIPRQTRFSFHNMVTVSSHISIIKSSTAYTNFTFHNQIDSSAWYISNVRNILKLVVWDSSRIFSHANHIKITIYIGDFLPINMISNSRKQK